MGEDEEAAVRVKRVTARTCSSPPKGLASFSAIVNDYIRHYRRDAERDLRRYRGLPLRRAIELAGRSEDPDDGKRYSHQRRLPGHLLATAVNDLLAREDEIRVARDFASLHDLVKVAIRWKGIGGLAIYDISLRIAANRGFAPHAVYLHAGTKEGALVLGFRGKTLDPAELPQPFQRLLPREIEDVLCIYRDELVKIARARFGR